jgi:hypothetical protein
MAVVGRVAHRLPPPRLAPFHQSATATRSTFLYAIMLGVMKALGSSELPFMRHFLMPSNLTRIQASSP